MAGDDDTGAFDIEEFAEDVKQKVIASARAGGCTCCTCDGPIDNPHQHELQQ
jgi:hypothetical protein